MKVTALLKHGTVEIDWLLNTPLPTKGDHIFIDRMTVDALEVTKVKFSIFGDSEPAQVMISISAE